mmetsp:Transcript_14805/g.27852  ORF Transcript_14805/g.27852 Transcript_14805/m.27852 type:complete len:94 (+) Transcript_14805:2-283(+)
MLQGFIIKKYFQESFTKTLLINEHNPLSLVLDIQFNVFHDETLTGWYYEGRIWQREEHFQSILLRTSGQRYEWEGCAHVYLCWESSSRDQRCE